MDQQEGPQAFTDLFFNKSSPHYRESFVVDSAVPTPDTSNASSNSSSLKVLLSSTPSPSTPAEDEVMSEYISEHDAQHVDDLQDVGTQFD